MSTALQDVPATAADDEPAGRGRLDIDRGVLRKIVEHAAGQIADAVTARGRGPSARVTGPDRELRIRLDVALRYPASIHDSVRSMREHVRDELDRLAGCRVRVLEVTVSALVPAEQARRVE